MKSYLKHLTAMLLALTICLSLLSTIVWASEEDHTSDGSDSSISIAEENPIAVLLSENSLTLFTGKSATLKATVQPEGEHTIRWSSDNKKVATVDSMGKVIAKGAGNCTITATVDDVTATCAVTVKKPTIKLNKTSLSLDVKKTATLKATVDGPSKKVTWKSSNTKIATVDKNGKVTAKKAGSCTITATANEVSKNCKVTVVATWRRAYAEMLNKIDANNKFHLSYLDSDSIPELIISDGIYHYSHPTIYTYYGNKVKKIDSISENGYFSFASKKNIIIADYWSYGHEDKVFYKITKGKLKEINRFSHFETEYEVNGKKVTKKVYTKKLSKAKKGCKYKTAGYSAGYKITEKNIRKIITNPKSVTK